MLGAGENTVATRLTVYRQAVVWLIIGGYGALITWLSVRQALRRDAARQCAPLFASAVY
jgi:hypothetical protein